MQQHSNVTSKALLERNIVKYSWFRIFTKRVYLPLITVQLVNVGKVSLDELALMVIISSIVQALLQMPAGYVADSFGNRRAIILGTSIAVTSPLFYAFLPTFWGGLLASLLFFGGYAFLSGAVEAFMHDTLVALGRGRDYTKVMGRAQTYGLVGNTVLIILIPLTYQIHHTLPFILGFLSLAATVCLAFSFAHPPRQDAGSTKRPMGAAKAIITPRNLALFVFAGFLAGVSNKGTEYRELLFQHVGVGVEWFGVIAAVGSIGGALLGWYAYWFDKLRPLAFYWVDGVIMAASIALMGASSWPPVVIAAVVLFTAYTRVRPIVLQAKILSTTRHTYKATLISALNMFTLLGDVLAISLLTHCVNTHGYLIGHRWFGGFVGLIAFSLWLVIVLVHYTSRTQSARPAAAT